ncbi:YciI family protein [Streptacidiphilus rugosus]|uniref:hypothetical protein n=1 Tax=Streptacidiphilus rugosus TaxID=405783 RepID=UPI00068E9FDE|nr:hypothetical protein [Streptacidiphilus rugosus]
MAKDKIKADLHQRNEELRDSGSWVFTGDPHAPSTAAVLRTDGMLANGRYVEGKEYVSEIWVIAAPDLNVALEWGSIGVRTYQGVEPY